MRAPSYANVAATLALVVALGGTAYAAGLPKDSVRSKQIKNGAVKSLDVKDAGLTGVDVADGSLTGADLGAGSVTGVDVDESTLAQVPDAATLAGIAPGSFRRAPQIQSDGIMEGAPLSVSIPNYGTFSVSCNDNNTPTANDDLAQVSHFPSVSGFSGGAVTTKVTMKDSTGGPGELEVGGAQSAIQASSGFASSVYMDYVVRRTDGTKALHMRAWGWDDTTTIGCYGQLEIEILA